jgi:excisionase family DNA binding protein
MAHLLTKDEAADQLRISIRTLERWVSEGRLTVIKLSPGAVRVDQAEVDRLTSKELGASA